MREENDLTSARVRQAEDEQHERTYERHMENHLGESGQPLLHVDADIIPADSNEKLAEIISGRKSSEFYLYGYRRKSTGEFRSAYHRPAVGDWIELYAKTDDSK